MVRTQTSCPLSSPGLLYLYRRDQTGAGPPGRARTDNDTYCQVTKASRHSASRTPAGNRNGETTQKRKKKRFKHARARGAADWSCKGKEGPGRLGAARSASRRPRAAWGRGPQRPARPAQPEPAATAAGSGGRLSSPHASLELEGVGGRGGHKPHKQRSDRRGHPNRFHKLDIRSSDSSCKRMSRSGRPTQERGRTCQSRGRE